MVVEHRETVVGATGATESGTTRRAGSYRLLMFLGLLWLLLAVGLLLFQLTGPAKVTVEWYTATEVDTAGFYLYRSEAPDGEYQLLNNELIAGKGDSQSGAAYSYADEDVQAGETYYYLLEELELDASRSRYLDDIFSYSVPQTWWVMAVSAFGLVAGVAFLVASLRERKRLL